MSSKILSIHEYMSSNGQKNVIKGVIQVCMNMREKRGVRGEIFSCAAQLPLLIHQVSTTLGRDRPAELSALCLYRH